MADEGFGAEVDLDSVRLSRTATWGGLETESHYGETPIDYGRDLGDPGEFPYTRGSYPKMYRSRMWTLRNIVGYGAPEDTRDGIAKALAAGGAGVDVAVDTLTAEAVDPDHPALRADVGLEGCSLPSLRDVKRLLDGVDITRTDVAYHSTMMIYPMIAAFAVDTGVPLADIQGSHMPDHLQLTLAGWGEKIMPADLAHRATVDCVEYAAKHSPRWALGLPQAYDLRERGLTPVAEIAVGMAIANATLTDLAARGVPVDQVAPSLAWVSITDVDLFEEVAKFRALRRVWARTMKERFGATDPRAMRLRIACHTSGRSLTHQQPLNNLARATVQTLAALLGGVQSVEACTWDEPVGIPTHEARELATRTQQILAHEVGAARTADPLGGSWYVESLTDRVEAEALALLARIEERRLVESVRDGSIEALMDEFNYRQERELATGERIKVGVNRFVPTSAEQQPPRFRFDRANVEAHIQRFVELKRHRDNARLAAAAADLYAVARRGENPVGAMIEALRADGSIAEVWGTVRVAHGHPYDPFGVLTSPWGHTP
ncbi:methylmalonyl-CoA mutase family protein [Pseudonocardia eucalypti]|uniref:Methylmalonyl-CoA mutase family protein n=1 Tax=Pseudonocardia eucalypti TaxID=648755 RepID=A0ABP9PRY5_9PSEU|nr:methylmalonyl-CoA mutase N-terminal domain/subunit [Pseudonocardia eucalypti]